MAETLPAAIVLAGGFGTRLKDLAGGRPKPMVDINGRPFLEFVVEHLRRQGVPRILLSVGYKAELIEAHFGDGSRFGVPIHCLRETEPLGTAGALRLALPHLGERALALNGDSYVAVDLPALLALHRRENAALSIAAVPRSDASRFGRMKVDGARLLAFEEKQAEAAPGLINAGVYLFERRVLESIPAGRAVSLERETVPELLAAGQTVAVLRHEGYFEDIGVPEGLAAFRSAAPSLLRSA